ncbi:MAG TPA: ATP-binding protein, partial [Chloroflexia bacterium]|nr:ATP-binding protein [Chloroflexia bacterium]
SRLKEEFLSLLSHELRAPLTVIMGYAQMMERKLERSGAESDAKSARMIREQAIRMSGMVGDIVDSGRLESGVQNINKEKINIEELVEHVVTRMRMEQPAMPQGRDITLRVEPGLPPVLGDMRRIDQVLTNILSNAIRYSPDGSPISIEVKLEGTARGNHGSEQSNRFVLVSVTDQGIGIEEDERERIFERAYRSQRGQITSAQGLGLGLYICKLEVEAHGGTIGVDDGPGGVGSTFWFTIPVE